MLLQRECKRQANSDLRPWFFLHFTSWVMNSKYSMHSPVFQSFQVCVHVWSCNKNDKRAEYSRNCWWGLHPKNYCKYHSVQQVAESLYYRFKKNLRKMLAVEKKQDDVFGGQKSRKERREAIRTPKYVHLFHVMIDKDSGRPMRFLTRKRNVDENTVWNCLHKNNRYKYYVLKKHQYIKKATMKSRSLMAARLLCKHKQRQSTNRLNFFSDANWIGIREENQPSTAR